MVDKLVQAYWQGKLSKLTAAQKKKVAEELGCSYTTILHKINGRRRFTTKNLRTLKTWKTDMCK